MIRRAFPASVGLTLAAVLAACSSPREESGAISADDQRQLNEAAAVLDANGIDAHPAPGHESSPHD